MIQYFCRKHQEFGGIKAFSVPRYSDSRLLPQAVITHRATVRVQEASGSNPDTPTIIEPTVDTIISCRFVIFMRKTVVLSRLFHLQMHPLSNSLSKRQNRCYRQSFAYLKSTVLRYKEPAIVRFIYQGVHIGIQRVRLGTWDNIQVPSLFTFAPLFQFRS